MQYMPDASSDTLRINSTIQAEGFELETNKKKGYPGTKRHLAGQGGEINIFLKREQENV